MITFLIFIAVLAVLVLSHEFGHFIFAKKAGLRVEEFGFGFPPKIFGFKKGDTVYSVNMIPLGGFVKISGEDGGEINDEKSFGSQPLYTRALILVAGVFFNLLLAWPVLTAGFLIGTPASIDGGNIRGGTLTEKGVMIIEVQKNTPAETSGLKEGDYLLSLISREKETLQVSDEKGVQDFIIKYAGTEIMINYLRGEKGFSAKVVPLVKPEAGKGSLGIAMERVGIMKLPLHLAIWEGLKSTLRLTGMIAKTLVAFFGDLVTERKMVAQISGPVGIAGMVGSAAQTGFSFFLQLVAILSIHLALINIVPFPALDGGRLLFLAIEFFRGKPISPKTSNIAHNIGFAILILLMLIITYKDILKLI